MIISRAGVIIMHAGELFERKIYKELGLRPVFQLKQEFFEKTHNIREEIHNGATVYIMDCDADETLLEGYPSVEEVREFIRLRETFCAEELLQKSSWADFVRRCELEGITDIIQRHRPCEDPTGQCKIDCPRFNNCDKAKEVEYLYNGDC